jgi:hypothetical protein
MEASPTNRNQGTLFISLLLFLKEPHGITSQKTAFFYGSEVQN